MPYCAAPCAHQTPVIAMTFCILSIPFPLPCKSCSYAQIPSSFHHYTRLAESYLFPL